MVINIHGMKKHRTDGGISGNVSSVFLLPTRHFVKAR
jgi:hypothetical protein